LHLKLDGATYNAASASSSTILSADKGSAIVFEVGRNMSADINQASLVTGGAFDLIGVSNGADNAVLSLHNSSNIVANSGAALVNQTSTGSFALNADNTQMKGAIVTTAGSTTATLDNNSVWTLAARGTNPSVMRNNTLSTLNINGNSTLDASGGNFVINGPGSNLTTAKVNNLAGTINLYNAAGQTGSVLTIGGDWTQGSAGTLNILGDNGSAKMVTNNANLAGTLAIFNPYLTVPTKASLVGAEQIHVVQSNNAITGDFDQIQMTLATPDYLYYAGHKNNSDLNYDVGLAMSWFRGATDGHGTFTLPNATDTFEIDIPLPDQAASATGWDGTTLTKQGAGTLILSAPNAYTGATEINGGHVMLQGAGDIATSRAVQLNVADAVLDVSGITAAETTLQNLFGVAGSQLVRVDREVTLANSTNTVFAGDFDASTATLTKTGTGALTLSGQTAWTGQTLVQQGTLILDGIQGKARLTSDVGGDSNAVLALQNGAVLTGEIQEPRLTIDGHSVWNMTASSTVAALSHAGTINIAPPGLGGFKTLTVLGGNYVGLGGRVNMSTFLGTDGSPSDKIVINGGTATGTTSLRITNAGGAGALTIGNGILVVDTINGGTSQTGAFGLNGRAVAGAYEYLLFRGSVDASNPDAWYLRSAQPAPPPPGPTPPTPSPSPPSPQPLYRPEVGAYLSNQRVAAGMLVQSLHDRLGEPQWSEQQTFSDDDSKRRSVWLRFVGKDIGSRSSDSNFDVSSDVFLLQGGADIATWSLFRGDDRLHVGAMLGYGWASSDASAKGNPFTATADVNGVSVGAYGTWFQNDESRLGWYTDLWAQYGWFTNHVTGQDLPSVGYHSEVLALSAEAGYAWYPFPQLDWVIEPQGQVIYEHGFESGFDEPNGTHIDGARGSGWITRLGVRFHRTWMDTAGKRYQPYVTLNWWHDAIDNVVAFNQVSMRDLYPENRYEIKLGIDIEGKKGWTGWSNVGWQVGSQSYHAFIGRIGVKKTW
jgi:outer membrane autotransporter protein